METNPAKSVYFTLSIPGIRGEEKISSNFNFREKNLADLKQANLKCFEVRSTCICINLNKFNDKQGLQTELDKFHEIMNESSENFSLEMLLLNQVANKLLTCIGKQSYSKKIAKKLLSLDEKNQNYHSLSALVGACLGNCIGKKYEFKHGCIFDENEVFEKNTLPGEVNIDVELTLCMVLGLMNTSGEDKIDEIVNKIAYYYGYFTMTNPDPSNIGRTMKEPLFEAAKNFKKSEPERIVSALNFPYDSSNAYHYRNSMMKKAQEENKFSLSNGFLMRKIPIAAYSSKYSAVEKLPDPVLLIHNSYEHIVDKKSFDALNVQETLLTHSNVVTLEGSLIYSRIITRLMFLSKNYSSLPKKQKCEITLNYIKQFCAKRLINLMVIEKDHDLKTFLSSMGRGFMKYYFLLELLEYINSYKNTEEIKKQLKEIAENFRIEDIYHQQFEHIDIKETHDYSSFNITKETGENGYKYCYRTFDSNQEFIVSKEEINSLKEFYREIIELTDFCGDYDSKFNEETSRLAGGKFTYALNLGISFLSENARDSSNKAFVKDTDMYIEFMKFVITLGGDTDTNCYIAGGIIGALLGLKELPSKYIDILLESVSLLTPDVKFVRPLVLSPGMTLLCDLNRTYKGSFTTELMEFLLKD